MNNKQEWLEKVKIQSPKKIKNKNSILFFDVNTCLFEVSEELKNDYDINFAAAIIGNEFLWNIHEDLRDDKKFILSLMENGYKRNIYDFLSKNLKKDEELFIKCLERDDPIFNNNKELITKIIEKNGKYLKKFSQYINDIDMVKLALKTYNHIDILTPNMLENKELVLDILKKDPSECKHLFSLKKYVNDLDVMKLAIKHDHKLFYHSNSITDIEILNYVVEKTEDFALVIKEQIQNKELMIKLINNKENINLMMCNQNFIYKYKNDIEIVQKIISIDPTQIEKFPKFKKDKDIIFYALQCGLSQINKIDVSLYHDIDIVNSFIKKNSINYINLPLDMKNNHEIALRSINNNKDFFMVINNSELEQDISFYIKAIRKKHELFAYITENNDLKLNEKIILGYIESCHEKMLTPQIPIDILDNFKCRNVTELKIFLLKNQIEKELNNTNNSQIFEEKKNKIKI